MISIFEYLQQKNCQFRSKNKDELDKLLGSAEKGDKEEFSLPGEIVGPRMANFKSLYPFFFTIVDPEFAPKRAKDGRDKIMVKLDDGTELFYECCVSPDRKIAAKIEFSSAPTQKVRGILAGASQILKTMKMLAFRSSDDEQQKGFIDKFVYIIIPTNKTSKVIDVNKPIIIEVDLSPENMRLNEFIKIIDNDDDESEDVGKCINGHLECDYIEVCPCIMNGVNLTKTAI